MAVLRGVSPPDGLAARRAAHLLPCAIDVVAARCGVAQSLEIEVAQRAASRAWALCGYTRHLCSPYAAPMDFVMSRQRILCGLPSRVW
eukprot:GDKH01009026.1.p3 GENE.GDKH01009026.1~~GDKH01009026.1.p3  ORF type:complete len:88 (-),score=10.02 GDKH01009026.1:164-427(-)